MDSDMLRKGEKPVAYLDIPINFDDFEVIDLFNWRKEAQNKLSQQDFTRTVDLQTETVSKYINDQKILPDMAVPIGDSRLFNYFSEETVQKYAKEFNWDLITASNIKDKFMDFIRKMDMSFSYKPVLIEAVFEHMDENGMVKISNLVEYFKYHYEWCKEKGLVAEKSNSIYQKGGYTDKDVERNIINNPFKRFADMRFLMRSKDVAYVEINRHIFKNLTQEDKDEIWEICGKKLEEYYGKMGEETH